MKKGTYEAQIFNAYGTPVIVEADTHEEAVGMFDGKFGHRGYVSLRTECPHCHAHLSWDVGSSPWRVIPCIVCKNPFRICTEYERQSCESCNERIECLTLPPNF
jgi:hypothetical protein